MSESRDVREDGAEHGLALLITDLDRGVSIVEVNEDGNKDPADRRSDHGGVQRVNGGYGVPWGDRALRVPLRLPVMD